ncbi:MAG: hypothetical protein MJZ90_11575 [Bacteroidales bacterium]|nr:hypothetical protein [Bacteroidales bacterium]
MNIEDFIRDNKSEFAGRSLPEGHRERFLLKLEAAGDKDVAEAARRNKRRSLLTIWNSVAAAAIVTFAVVTFGWNKGMDLTTKLPQTPDNQLIELRTAYEQKVEDAIVCLEKVMENIDDSTRIQITEVIHNLENTGDIFAEIAPLPQDRQMAIVEHVFDNKLKAIDLITKQINR